MVSPFVWVKGARTFAGVGFYKTARLRIWNPPPRVSPPHLDSIEAGTPIGRWEEAIVTITVGLAGAGRRAARVHAPALASAPDIEFVGIWALSPGPVRALADRHGVQ